LIPQDGVNRQIAAPAQTGTKVLREPVFIRSTGKKSSGTMLAPKIRGKRTLTHAVVVVLTMIIVLGALGAVLPLTSNGHAAGIGSLVNSLMSWSQTKNNNTALIESQIATATAVTQDGYDPGNVTFPGVQAAPASVSSSSSSGGSTSSSGSLSASDAGSLSRFFYGQCTYWANMRYHELTGHWVPWLGNANEWPYQAAAYGWVVSSTPHLHSIMAFPPYVQGAGGYGHVAIVESINGDAITTSNWNVYGAAWATTTYLTNYAGSGVTFLYYPGN
jgi:surface antigen